MSNAAEQTLESRVRRLEDLREIDQLLIDYGEFLDLRDLDSFAQLWTEDAEFHMSTGRSAKGRDAIRSMLADVMERNTDAAMHIETNPRIAIAGDRGTATIMFAVGFGQDDGTARITMFGHHHDVLFRTAEGWKIARRHNVVELPVTGHP